MSTDTLIAAGFQPAARMAGIEVSEILVRSAKAMALRKAGKPMVILGAGEPDFDTPEHVKEAAARAIRDGQTKYTAVDGSPDLKDAVRDKFSKENGLEYTRDQITCGAGAKQILFNAFMATLDPGDEVIVPAPFWTSYVDIVRIAGGIPIEVPCRAENGFLLQPDQLEAAITSRTRWLLLNSPSNPSGAAYDDDALRGLAQVLRRHPRLWIMSDDMYEHILYDDRKFATMAAVCADLQDRTLTINGVSKAYAMTGWRLGYGAGPAPLISAMASVQSQATSCPSSVSQAAAIAALTGPQDLVRERCQSFQDRRDYVIERLTSIPGVACEAPAGAFYAYPSCEGLMGSTTPAGSLITTDRDLADYFVECGVAMTPGSCFGLAPYLRLSYASALDELTTALDRMEAGCAALARS